MQPRAFIFDLDGVIVDTAKYHFAAWERLAASLGFRLPPEVNERLKGVSRRASLEVVLSVGGLSASEEEKEALAERKNLWYRELLSGMGESELLPGARAFLEASRALGLRIALGSASRNAPDILSATGIGGLFDAVVDGRSGAPAKPAPELFLLGARALGVAPADCAVFEDAAAGIEAALAAGMAAVGVGEPAALGAAHLLIPGFAGLRPAELLRRLAEARAPR